MKAIILREYGNADNLNWQICQFPQSTKGQVRIKLKAVSFNPVDYQIRKGLPEGKFVRSNILGRDLSGIIDDVAEDVY